MKREQLWDLRHSINRVKLDDPKLHDEISNSYKDEINNLLTINELEDLVQKIRYTSYLYDMIINFYKFLNTKNNQVEVSFVDLLSLL